MKTSEDIAKILEESKGWNAENPKISELKKKVARLEGQMSMIGGKFHE